MAFQTMVPKVREQMLLINWYNLCWLPQYHLARYRRSFCAL